MQFHTCHLSLVQIFAFFCKFITIFLCGNQKCFLIKTTLSEERPTQVRTSSVGMWSLAAAGLAEDTSAPWVTVHVLLSGHKIPQASLVLFSPCFLQVFAESLGSELTRGGGGHGFLSQGQKVVERSFCFPYIFKALVICSPGAIFHVLPKPHENKKGNASGEMLVS